MTRAASRGTQVDRPTRRCAIYTRKSSEEGLEQNFNSLDAQREACEAFIASQKHEGWQALPELYDDGGFSGATMERPALQRLLLDVTAGKIDVVVVYKVDRLTRSLSDFAKIVETFDQRKASFVSVTQQFNTTSSMGRLTLNILLSFAQFEREVTGERIRDKIAASKKKGMWMGGQPSLGYDVKDKKLIVNKAEAETVRHIFRRYIELKSVRLLKADLDAAGIVSKARTASDGSRYGQKPLARGALYLMLQNRIYRGEIVHKENAYPGLHHAIVDEALWDEVHAALIENRVERQIGATAKAPSLLTGLVYDDSGERMSPTHANKKGTRYRYYVSQSLIKRGRPTASDAACRVPAADLESVVEDRICVLLKDEAAVFNAAGAATVAVRKSLIENTAYLAQRWPALPASDKRAILHVLVSRIDVRPKTVDIAVRPAVLPDIVKPDLDVRRLPTSPDGPAKVLSVSAKVRRTGLETKLLVQGAFGPAHRQADRSLLRLIAQARRFNDLLLSSNGATIAELAARVGVSRSYFTRVFRLSFLAPEIAKAILQGHQPSELSAIKLMGAGRFASVWSDQRRQLGFD